MKNASLLVLVLALGTSLPVHAQTTGDAPAEAPTGGAALAEPEPEVSDEVEGAADPESGTALGQAAPTTTPTVSDDLAEATAESSAPASQRSGEQPVGGEAESTADRLAQAVPNAGLPWSMPITAGYAVSTRTFNRNGQLTYTPFQQLSLNAAFRWNFGGGLLAGIVQGMNYELSTNQGTVNAGFTQPQTIDWPDTRLDVTYTLPWKPLGVSIATQLALFLPTSKFSRASNRALGISPLLFVVKGFPVMEGLLVNALWRYTGWTGDLQAVENPFGYECTLFGGETQQQCHTGANPIRHSNSAFLSVTLLPISQLALSLSYGGVWLRRERAGATGVLEGVVTVDPDGFALGAATGRNDLRFHNFTASITYDFTTYLTLGIAYDSFTTWQDDSGDIRQPFHDENTVLRFTLQFRPDFFTADLRQRRAAEAAAATPEATVRRALPTRF
ncbi:MAG: hypothetical protein MUE69_04855 [Myxococcota bacterium]|nr:hypothetical protein [Myxococcota bacterium]